MNDTREVALYKCVDIDLGPRQEKEHCTDKKCENQR